MGSRLVMSGWGPGKNVMSSHVLDGQSFCAFVVSGFDYSLLGLNVGSGSGSSLKSMLIHNAGLRLSYLNLRQRCRYAIVTLDGSVMLVDDDPDKKPVDSIMWNLQVNRNPALVYLLPTLLLFII